VCVRALQVSLPCAMPHGEVSWPPVPQGEGTAGKASCQTVTHTQERENATTGPQPAAQSRLTRHPGPTTIGPFTVNIGCSRRRRLIRGPQMNGAQSFLSSTPRMTTGLEAYTHFLVRPQLLTRV
jgi:hypothetical protein